MNIKSVLFLKNVFLNSSVDFISIPLKILLLFFSLSSIKYKICILGVIEFDIFGLKPKTIAFFSLELS